MSTSKRFVVEGEWSGYHSGQTRIVHRTVHSGSYRKLRQFCSDVGSIEYTDGTCLRLSVRDCKPRERVTEIRGYTSLINDCCYHGVSSVAALPKATP